MATHEHGDHVGNLKTVVDNYSFNYVLAPLSYDKSKNKNAPFNKFARQVKRMGKSITVPEVGDNVWFGAGVTVCPGVTIGSNTVIGAGSIVVHDIPDGVVVAGNPCRVIRPISYDDKHKYPICPEDKDNPLYCW